MEPAVPQRSKTTKTNANYMPNGRVEARGSTWAVIMMNPIVLTEVGAYLPAVDLLALRHTCLTWNSVLIPQLRRKHSPIKLTAAELGKFVQVMKTSASIPFSSYQIGKIRTGLDEFVTVCGGAVTKLSIEVEWFARGVETSIGLLQAIFGPRMDGLTELALCFSDSRLPFEPEGTESGAIRAEMQIPKLKRFQFTTLADRQPPWARVYLVANLIHALVTGAGTESLQFPGHEPNQWGFHYLAQFLTYAKHTNGDIASLRALEVGHLTLPLLRLLLNLAERKQNCLRLETLSYGHSDWMSRDSDEVDEGSAEKRRIWTSFLTLLAPHLLQLTVVLETRQPSATVTPIWLPRMERLRTLTITGSEHEPRTYALRTEQDTLTFTESFPALRKLSNYRVRYRTNAGAGFSVHAGVTKLCLNYPTAFGESTAWSLPASFPSVTYLDLTLEACANANADECSPLDEGGPGALYAVIWSTWPALKSLNLNVYFGVGAGLSIEELLTGVTCKQLTGLRQELDGLVLDGVGRARPCPRSCQRPLTLEDFARLSHKYKTRPGISDLRQLESFALDWSSDQDLRGWSNFTDLCVYAGIALIGPQLQRLRVKCHGGAESGVTRVSDGCLQFLRSVNGPNTLIDIN